MSGVSDDSPGNAIKMNLTPTLNGFELNVHVSAAYTASDIANSGVSPEQDIATNCMDIDTPAQSQGQNPLLYEAPLATNLSATGDVVTGSLTYAAVIPGSYSFDLGCLSRGGSQSSTIIVGSVATPNKGILYGSGDNDNAIVVFSEQVSATDTAITYGAVGSSNDGSEPHLTANTCIVNSPPNQNNNVNVMQDSKLISQQRNGNGQWFEVGSLTYNVSASQLNDATFLYDCSDTNNGWLPFPS